MRRRLINKDKGYANGVYIQAVDGKLYTKAEWEAYKPADGVYIETIDGSLYTKEQYQALKDYGRQNGVYIQDTNGNLYTKEEWEVLITKPIPNGIAVISDEASFVVALSESPSELEWQTTVGEITDLPDIASSSLAKLDFNGKSNSDIIATVSNGGANAPANAYCQNFTFPDGSKGYLPALGELWIARQNLATINELLTLTGGTNMTLLNYWSSSENRANSAWYMSFSSNCMYTGGKSFSCQARTFTSLSYAKEKQPNGVCVVSGGHIFTIAPIESPGALIWGEPVLVNYATAMSGELAALGDYKGNSNTGFIVSQLNASYLCAPVYCQSFTFPDGSKGYLPSLGEWQIAYSNKAEIDSCMSLIKGIAINSSGYHWTSTQYSDTNAWIFSWNGGFKSNTDKINARLVRAFTATKKYTPKGIAVVTDEARFVVGLYNSGTVDVWQNNASDIMDLPNLNTEAIARQDFNGRNNSITIASASNGGVNAPANAYCHDFTFPEGSKGYLPSCGELLVAYQNRVLVNELLALIGGDNMSVEYWSSTEGSRLVAWIMSFSLGGMGGYNKSDSTYSVRPFTPLSF